MTDLEKRINSARKMGGVISAKDKAAAEQLGLDITGIKVVELPTKTEYFSDTGYTGGGNTTVRIGYGSVSAPAEPATSVKEDNFGGRQPERTQEQKDKIKAMMAEFNTPEARAFAEERAAHHAEVHGDYSDNYDDD